MTDLANPAGPGSSAAGEEPPDQPSTPPRLEVDPDSPFADVLDVYTSSDRAQLVALETTASLFLAEVIDHLGLLNPNPEFPYRHATLTETASRFADAANREGETSTADGVATPSAEADAECTSDPSAESTADGDAALVEAPSVTPDATSVPGFPRFRETQTIDGWVHMHSHTEEIGEFTAILGTTTAGTYAHINDAMTLVHGLPKFHARCLAGEFTIAHVHAATRLCKSVRFSDLRHIDDYLETRRADITIETFKKSLAMRVSVLEPADERTQQAFERRRVDITTYPDGSSCLTLTGPSAELQACFLRIEAFAKAIRNGNTAAFGDQIPDGAVIEDDRAIAALMFDIFTRTCPQVRIQVRTEETDTGVIGTSELPLDLEGVRNVADVAERITAAAEAVGISADPSVSGNRRSLAGTGACIAGDSADITTGASTDALAGRGADAENASGSEVTDSAFGPIARTDHGIGGDSTDDHLIGNVRRKGRLIDILLTMPTDAYWLAAQGKMITTVPFLTLLGYSDLPGTFPDGSPIPADTARRIARECSTWTRILTDPATGTPVDANAMSYYIPARIRQTLTAKWQACTMPGCRRRAEASEVDHIIPFDHDNPALGGLTVFGNLHPLCKKDHQSKTDGNYSVAMNDKGIIEYRFPHGIRASVAAGDNPVNVEHARLMESGELTERGELTESGSSDEYFDPRFPPPPPEPDPQPGDVRTGEECPGPEGSIGTPGWVKRTDFFRSYNGKKRTETEWVWDNGDPPPF
ncbi:13E12 repeat family protein [Mycobacteroides abscessus subsp. abscessus]|uniref:HNH endonuclease n=1 Tax=Brevibacterium casei S18 TaxID=1229781 RepID=K9AJB7_9MICO|nr:HNH endonuclease signature motif containing protein [Brevibacterium casei]EKU47354.1 HNH endonuclease [Brevibacterium casei S18]NJE66618.1 HNH endonuclease [Brevibacterium sp. LS14]SIH10866.1 13E12 repeat family protein [Mycobacteroides abscessus subsp. abscessus]